MRILIVTMFGLNDNFRYCHQWQTAWSAVEAGHEVFGYACLNEKDLRHNTRFEKVRGVTVRRFKIPKLVYSHELFKAFSQDGPFDIVHLHHLRNRLSYQIVKLCKKTNTPLIFQPHGPLHDPYLVKDRNFPYSCDILYGNVITTRKELSKRILKTISFKRHFKNFRMHYPLGRANKYIALAKPEKEILEKLGIESDKIVIVPHWANLEVTNNLRAKTFEEGFSRPTLLFVGQLKYRRGFDLAVKILARVKKENPSATLIVVTNNPDKKRELLEVANKEGVTESLILKENISEEEKFSLYKQADIYISPTRYEGFGVTFLEAMACGCPIVASSIPVVNEIVEDGKTGLLARLEDPYDFARAIKRLMADASLREGMIKNGLEKVKKEYNKEHLFNKLLGIYERLC